MDYSALRRTLLVALLLVAFGTGTGSALTWQNETVDSAGNVGEYSSLALDRDGNPHISYRDVTNADLKYAWRDGEGWHNVTVDSTGAVGWYTSIALDGAGNARIGYCDLGSMNLKYAARNGSGWDVVTVDAPGSVGMYASLDLDSAGSPGIGYFDSTKADLKYAWHDGDGWQNETVDSAGDVGRYASLALDGDGAPHISYRDQSNSDLKYAWRDGEGWHNVTVDSTNSVGRDTSIALDSAGNPHISYYDESSSVLKYARHDGIAWQIEQVDLAWAGWHSSIALDGDGSPHISYRYFFSSPANMKVKYAWRDGDGWHTEAVASDGYVDSYTSLALDASDRPRISFYDTTNADLVFAWAGPVPPVADFAANVTTGAVPLAVRFTDASTHGPTTWAWEFGDGGTATEQNPVHVYEAAGAFTVNLTATNADGNDTETKPAFITVVQPFPGAPAAPTDPDGDGIYDDVNGNDRPDFADIVLFFNLMDWIVANEPVPAFDCNGNGRIDFADVVWLFNHL